MPKTQLMKTVINCETGQAVESEFTAEEYAQWEIDTQNQLAIRAAQEAKATAKAALLDRLGITADEAKLLLS